MFGKFFSHDSNSAAVSLPEYAFNSHFRRLSKTVQTARWNEMKFPPTQGVFSNCGWSAPVPGAAASKAPSRCKMPETAGRKSVAAAEDGPRSAF
jgi:hypothetical protein